jgi:excisionase family DNA binding protein
MEFLTVAEVAKLMHVRRSRVYTMMAAGLAPSVHIGGRVHVPRAAWDQWCAEQTAKALANMRPEKASARDGR